jgi:hypothetical protein
MKKCTRCGSYAINPHMHGRDDLGLDLCDVCYRRKRVEISKSVIGTLLEELKKCQEKK